MFVKSSCSKQLFQFSESELSQTFCYTAHFDIFFVCFVYFGGDRSGMDKSSSATCLLYSGVVNGDPSPTWLRKYQEEDEEEAVKRAIEELEISFHKNFTTFFYLFFFSITLLHHFFLYIFYPRHLPGHQMFAKYLKNFTGTGKNIFSKNFNSER